MRGFYRWVRIMSRNSKVNKSVLNFIHARNFWQEGDADKFKKVIEHLKWQPALYGLEIPELNMIDPDLEVIFGEMLGDWITITEDSGVFRIPMPLIHFEDFDSLLEWRCAIAVDDNVFRIYNHSSGPIDARQGYEFDYRNPDEWIIEAQINLKQNDCVFYRPWVFHSFEERPLYCFKLLVEER